MFWNSRVRRSTSARIRSLCSRPSSAVSHDALMLLAATRMAVSGVRRSCPSDASSAVFNSSLWRVSSAALRSSRNCARSMAIATTPPSVSSVPGLDGPAGRRQQADRLGADPQRHEPDRVAVDLHRPVAGVRPGVGVELERWSGPTAKALSRTHACPGRSSRRRPRTHPSRPRAAAQWRRTPGRTGGRSRGRAMAIASRLSVMTSTSRLRSNSRASSSRRPTRFLRARARHGRQIAGDEADGQEREQRDPVLRVRDRQRPDRRQEEEVEAEHGDDRRRHRDPEARRRRDHEHDQQERRRTVAAFERAASARRRT